MNNNKKRDIPAATLAFLAKSAKAIGNLFASSAHDTPGPNQPFASIRAVSISCTTDIGVDLNDNPYKPMSHAKMTGDRMKMLMLTLPFMVRDFIAPEVIW